MLVAAAGMRPVAAQTSHNEQDELSEIVVTATRLQQDADSVPASISVVSGDDVQFARQQLGLDEALARVPGVFFQNRFNFAQDLRIAIRGFGARSNFGVRGIKILVDGIPETLADGQSQVDSIDLSSLRQVEVLRGPASAIYGNAAGGVISIQSELGDDESFAEARSAFGDFGYRKHQLKAAGSSGRLSYLLSLSDLKIDGYREHSEAENTQVNSRFQFALDESSTLSMSLSATDQPISNDPGGVTFSDAAANPSAARGRNVLFDAGEALEQQRVGVNYRRHLANGAALQVRGYYLARDFSNKLPFTAAGIVEFDRSFIGGGVSYEQSLQRGNWAHRFVVGLDSDRQADDRQRYDNDDGVRGDLALNQDERVNAIGVFFQDEIKVTDALELTLGLRYDRIEFDVGDRFVSNGDDSGKRTLDDVSPSFGFVYNLSADHSLYGGVATAFETPTTAEFANPDGSGGFNENLDPQKSTSIELGLRGVLADNVGYEIVAFSIELEDELLPFEIASSPGRDFFANAAASDRRGLELALDAELLDGLRATFAYTYSRFRFDTFLDDGGNDFSGNVIPGVPESFAYLDVTYTHGTGLYLAVDAAFTGSIYTNNANSSDVERVTIGNFRAGWRKSFDKLEISPFFGVNNLGDTAYTANVRINAFGGRFFEPGPERNVYGGVSLRYRYD